MMKKLLAMALAMALVMSCGVAAWAEIYVDGKKMDSPCTTGNAQYVSADTSGDQLTVNGNVTGEEGEVSVSSSSGAEINVRGTVTGESDSYSAIDANGGSTVNTGAVSASGNDSAAICACDSNTTVNTGNVNATGDNTCGIFARQGATINTGAVSVSGDNGAAICAFDSNTTVNTGNVNATGDFTGGISACYGATINTGAVSASGYLGDAINVVDAAVTVNGNVTKEDAGNAISADGGTVTVNGNVENAGSGDAIKASGATVTVSGNVEGNGNAINASYGATVTVGGDVAGFIYSNNSDTTVVVEGKTMGGVNTSSDSNVYVAESGGLCTGNIHYLIGTAAEGSETLSAVTLVSDIVADGTVDGVNKQGYRYTKTAKADELNGKTITLTPAAGSKLSVSGFDAGTVDCVQDANGAVTLTLKKNFHGGLANLILQLMKVDPQLAAAILADNTVYFDAANYDMQTGNITVTGADADAVTAYSQADHAGVTFAASLLKADGVNDIRVFNGEEELSSDDFSCHFHRDGSMSLIISNTYLLTGGSGAYSFKALVNGVEAAFDLAVVC